MDHSPLRLGIDLGGTKIEAALLDASGAIIWRKRIASPRNDYGATLAALRSLVMDVRTDIAAADKCTIGIGIPGSLSPVDGRVRNANSTWLNGQPLKRDLEQLLGQSVASPTMPTAWRSLNSPMVRPKGRGLCLQ